MKSNETSVVANKKSTIILFVALQIYFASNTLSFGFWKSGEFIFEYMLIFYGAWLLILTLLTYLILVVCRRFNSERLAIGILILCSLPFSWELWVRSIEFDSIAVRYAVCAALLPIIYTYFRIGSVNPRATGGVLVLLCAVSFVGHASIDISSEPSQFSDEVYREFGAFDLADKPNIHIVMLDAFANSSYTEEFMGIRNPAADYLASLDDVLYAGRMGFSEYVPTKAAWGTVFNLGEKGSSKSFSGWQASRLTVLLRENGYKIHTGFSSSYFGLTKGRWVDQYHRGAKGNLKFDLSCVTNRGRLEFCSVISRAMFAKLFLNSPNAIDRQQWKENERQEWVDTVIELIDKSERASGTPIFSGYHIYIPGHTAQDYNHDNQQMVEEFNQYYSRRLEDAKMIVTQIADLSEKYPNSFFIIAGDHGPYLSRMESEGNRRFNVLDKHGIALALLNFSKLCSSSKTWLKRQQYLTPSRILTAILTCGSENQLLIERFSDNEEFVQLGKSLVDSVIQPVVEKQEQR